MHRTPIRCSSAFHREDALSRRRFCKRCLYSLAALGLFLVAAGQGRPDFIYWSNHDSGEIRRSNLDGTEMTTLLSGLSNNGGPVLDFAGGMIWTEEGHIRRANLDGTGDDTGQWAGCPLPTGSGPCRWPDVLDGLESGPHLSERTSMVPGR
jgi:hypothetical protein